MSNFDPNAILRGAQLTVVGGSLTPHSLRPNLQLNSLASIQGIAEPWTFQI